MTRTSLLGVSFVLALLCACATPTATFYDGGNALSQCFGTKCKVDDVAPSLWDTEAEDSYDYTKPTCDAYKADEFVNEGEFAEARVPGAIDYSWHNYYTVERQKVQDVIIAKYLRQCVGDPVTEPWIIFMAGTMGAGKSHAIKLFAAHDLLPFDCSCYVDPDLVKNDLPEMREYMKRDRATAGSLTHMESAYMQEIILTEALRRQRHIVMDGSLRHGWFFKNDMFPKIREKHPSYKIGIVEVRADIDTVLERVEKRSKETGRDVPKEVLLESQQQVPESMKLLQEDVEFSITIDTSNGYPELVHYKGDTLVWDDLLRALDDSGYIWKTSTQSCPGPADGGSYLCE